MLTVITMTTERKSAWPQLDQQQEPAGPSALKAAICEEMARLCAEELGESLRAAVLTGSLARDEATFAREGERWSVLGDAEFLLIFHERTTLPPAPNLKLLRQGIENILLQCGILCPVSVSAVYPRYLLKMRPHIFGYELRTCGQVVWGEPQILSLIPAFSPSDIPLEDAWRLLCNRMVELLEVADQLVDKPGALSRHAHYRAVKIYLDMATSFLLFRGAYAPSYRERAEKLRTLADSTSAKDGCSFFPLRTFAERVSSCTQLKLQEAGGGDLSVTGGDTGPSVEFWEEVVAYARLLWRWELARLTGVQAQLSYRALLEKWMQLQPFGKRLRGWVYVLRKGGWHRSWRNWPHWVRRGWRASPRYWVYAAASELFLRLPALLRDANQRRDTDLNWKELRSWLPMVRECEAGMRGSSWQQVASEIARNYNEFVVGTRA